MVSRESLDIPEVICMKSKKKPAKRPVKGRIVKDISNSQLTRLAKKSAYMQHQARLADFHYKQKLAREFRKSYEDYIG